MKAFSAAVVCLLLVSAAAVAGEITSVSPSSLYVGSVEEFATIRGTALAGNVDTFIVFKSASSTIRLESNGGSVDGTTIYASIPDPLLADPGRLEVTVEAVDDNGTRTMGPVYIDVIARDVQQQPPQIGAPEVVVAEATSPSGANASFDIAVQGFGASSPALSCDHASGSFFPMGTTTVSCTASDGFGSSSTSFTVLVTDTTVPVVTVPSDITTANQQVTFTASATDNIDGTLDVTCSPASGSTFPFGKTTVRCVARDAHFNDGEASFVVTVLGGTPDLTLPGPITAEATSSAGAAVTYGVSATNEGVISCAPASGSTFALGTTTVQCTATNAVGSTSGSFNVTVVDTTKPSLTLPSNITAEATSAAGAAVTYTATASDIVDGSVTVNCNHASGSTFALGTTTVQCTATDAHHNTASGSFLVTVRDTTPPTLTLPADITAEATSASGAAVTFTATATDLVDGTVTVNCDHLSGSTFPLGTTAVQCSATDAHNNTAGGLFNVVVRDTTPPQIVKITATPDNIWPDDHKMVNVSLNVIAVDLVDPAPVSHVVSIHSSQPVDGIADGSTSPDWAITGPLTVQLRAERTGAVDRVYTITVESCDSTGNCSRSTTNVTVSQQSSRTRAAH